MKHKKQAFTGCKTLLSVAIAIGSIGTQAFADDDIVTLIEMGDLHHLHYHQVHGVVRHHHQLLFQHHN